MIAFAARSSFQFCILAEANYMTFPTALVAASVAFSAMFMASAAAFSVVTTVLSTAVLTFSLVGLSPQAARPSDAASASERSEEHTSELQSLMRNSYAVFCLKKKKYYILSW